MHARLLCCPLPQNNPNSFRFFNKDTNQTVSHQGRRSFFRPTGRKGDAPFQRARNLSLRATGGQEGFSPDRAKRDAHIAGGISPARRADKKEKTYGFPLLANHLLSLRRATGAIYRSPAKRLPPSRCCDRHGMAAIPETYPHNCGKISGLDSPFLLIKGSWAAETWAGGPLCASARPDLRQQMPQIFRQTLLYLLSLRRKRGDSQEGRKLGFSPLREPQRACMRATARRAALSES